MTNAIYRILGICSLMLLLAACSHSRQPMAVDDMDDANGGGDTPVDIIVSRSTFTDAGDNGETDTKFTPGCHIGVAVVGSTEYKNVQYKYPESGSALVAVGEKIYCGEKSSSAVKAYYPYRDDGSYSAASVEADQSTGDNYYESDALEAEGTISGGTLNLQFGHRMTKVILTFNEDVSDVTILNQSLSTSATTGAASIKPYKESARKWKACIVPGQTKLKVTGKQGSRDFAVTFNAGSAMLAGSQYSYTISSLIDISGCTREDLSEGSVSINDNNSYYITQSNATKATGNNITVSGGTPTIYIHDLNISAGTAIHITDGTPTIILIGYNTLRSTDSGKAGIRLQGTSAHVVIKGNGTLDSRGGGTAYYMGGGPGIGVSSKNEEGGNISIEGGTIVCTGDHAYAAAIGTSGDAGVNSKCGNISIKDATLILSKAGDSAAIGTGCADGFGGMSNLSCGTITIENSTLTIENTTGFEHSFIGKGKTGSSSTNNCGQVTITGSTINGTVVNDTYNP